MLADRNPVLGLENIQNSLTTVSREEVFSFPMHSHTYYEMLIYEPFDGYIIINDSKFFINSRTTVLIPPSHFHSISVTGCRSYVTKVSFAENALGVFFVQKIVSPLIVQDIDENNLINLLFDKILTYSEQTEYSCALIHAILICLTESGRAIENTADKKSNRLALRAAHIINERFCSKITLGTIAHELGISPQYLSNVFSKTMNIKLCDYICLMRLRYAAALILEGKMNITEICFECGYQNLSHFVRSFKKHFGVTPKCFAQSHCEAPTL